MSICEVKVGHLKTRTRTATASEPTGQDAVQLLKLGKVILLSAVIAGTLWLGSTQVSLADQSPGPLTGPSISQWELMELSFVGPWISATGVPNPFLIELDVLFTSPSSQVFDVPGFFDGDGQGGQDGDVWRVRFSPNEVGSWTYVTSSAEASLNGLSGAFQVLDDPGCSPQTQDGLPNFFCVGRLEYAGGHYLKFAEGPYWLKAGANEPEDLLAEESSAGFQDDQAAVDYLASHGVNSMYVMFHNIDGDDRNVWPWLGATQAEAKANGERFDTPKLAEWESLFLYAQAKGIVLHFVLEDDSAWTGFNRELFYREMIARFGHHNGIIWDISEEYNETYTPDEVQLFAEMLSGLDAYGHPVTVHHQGNTRAWEPFLGDPDFDLTSFQTGSTPQNTSAVSWFYDVEASGRTIPVSFDEPTRLLTLGERDQFRHIVWSVLLGGANLEIYTALSPSLGFQDYEAIFDDMVRARVLLNGYPFWAMRPHNELVLDGSAYVFAHEGDRYLLYLPSGGTLNLNLDLASGDLRAMWFDPRTGDQQDLGIVTPGPEVPFTAPSSEDWVLALEPDMAPSPSPTLTASLAPATATASSTLTVAPSSTASATASPTPTLVPSSTPSATASSTPTGSPSSTATTTATAQASPTPISTYTPSVTPTVQATQTGSTLLEDDFERPDGENVGNGWLEVETPSETIGLNSGELCVLNSSDGSNHPQALHSISGVQGDTLTWDFGFHWAIADREPSYLVFMQMGDGQLMRAANQNVGVGVNLLWGRLLGDDEQFGWRAAGEDHPLVTLSGNSQISVVANLNTHTYDLLLDGTLLAGDLPFENSVPVNTVRFFTYSVNLDSFTNGCFDNVLVRAGEGPIATASPTPTTDPASPTPSPTVTSAPSPTSTSSSPSPTPVATPTPTSTAVGGAIWSWNQTDLSEFSGHTSSFYIDLIAGNTAICSDDQGHNSYIGATTPSWPVESNYWLIGKIRFSGEEVRAGATVYYQDPQNLYQINLATEGSGPGTGQFRLRRFNNRIETQLIEDNSMHFLPDTWYEFRLKVETATDRVMFHLEVDDETGVRYLDYDDTSAERFDSGRVGLRKKQGDRACWDDLTVVSLTGELPTSTPVPTSSATPQGGTPTPTASATGTPQPATETPTASPSSTPTPGSANTDTPTPTPSLPVGTPTPTPTATPTLVGGAIWGWNGQDLGEFSGDLGAFDVETVDGSTAICSDSQLLNTYIGATVPAWSQDQDYEFEGDIYFSDAPVRGGAAIYYQDVNNLYKINLAADDLSPSQGQFRLIRVNGGRDSVLVENDVAHLVPGVWYSFRLSVQTLPTMVHFHLELDDEDGTDVIEFDDSSSSRLTFGRVGLRKKQGNSACWNSLAVYSLSLP